MADESKLEYAGILRQMAILAEQISRLHILEEALKAANRARTSAPS